MTVPTVPARDATEPPRKTSSYELTHAPSGSSWTDRENLADILERELLGPSRGDEEVIPVDTVVLALGVGTNDALYRELSQQLPNVHLIGDATTPRGKVKRTLEAVSEGYRAAMTV